MTKPVEMETLEERAAHERIRAAIGGLDAGATPRADWQARVMASVRAQAPMAMGSSPQIAVVAAPAAAPAPTPVAAPVPKLLATQAPRAPWWTRFLPMARPLALACAAAALVVVLTRGDAQVTAPVLTVELAATGVDVDAGGRRANGHSPETTFRGDAPMVGSRVRLTAESSAERRALWVFRGRDELVLQCPGAGCTEDDARLGASLQVERIGEYTVVALGSDSALPKPPATLDEALALLKRSGAAHRTHRFTVW